MLRTEKEKVVQDLVEKFQKAQGVYLADFKGLDVASITELRRKLRNAEVEFLVVKNTLAKLAVDEVGIPELKDFLVGPTSFALGYKDPIEPARVLVQFAREHERPQIRSALLEGQLLTAEQVADVASLPSKEELLAKIASLVQSPLAGFVYRCQGLLQKFVATLDAYRRKRDEGSSGEGEVGGEGTSREEGVQEFEQKEEITPQGEDASKEDAEVEKPLSETDPDQGEGTRKEEVKEEETSTED
jgi:large subunit ribosomal protein L10